MKCKYQVFISSTYEDLIEERQAAINKVMKLHQIPAGMELFGATGIDQWEYIRNEIDNSDYYLLILAGRYGSLHEEGIGYTELEYDYARKKGKHILAFLIKDVENLPNKYCESEQKEKLLRFRNKIQKEAGLVAYWTDIHDLSAKIGESLANVIMNYPAKTRWERVKNVVSREVRNTIDDVSSCARKELLQVGTDGYYHTEIVEVRNVPSQYRCYQIKGHLQEWETEDAAKTDWIFYRTGAYKDLEVGDKVRFKILKTDINKWRDIGIARNIYPADLVKENSNISWEII